MILPEKTSDSNPLLFISGYGSIGVSNWGLRGRREVVSLAQYHGFEVIIYTICSYLKKMDENMKEGVIVRLTDKGFGFISLGEGENDIFFHSNELKNVQFDDLKEGDKVTFEVVDGPKGPNAVNVNRV